MNSPGHRANILKRGFREVGIDASRGTFKRYSNVRMWTVDFGDRYPLPATDKPFAAQHVP